ncbi:phosphopantetheine-binding protein [Thalassospira alkalitolerans]|uniref:Acyl carrier protein n=1 Tax=Thalassospira alkalitolerans TaxID=1293890 RepID=A0A1Y2LAK0_9PROT|nr:phosphopantetheine-binding protein [Thalassospira alkalitolerans]OSQ47684.1 acyl carrier protein [Thalassospira alkalitolerans]|tara:strand:- start:69703 stop:69966 length:264 start_codon:yes stop_codon:yes gene_type:complete
MTSLETELKAFIIETLNLEDVNVDDIDSEEALFVDGLGLDSIDALELGVALQKKYDVRIDAKNEDVKTHFASVRNLAKFIHASGREG